MFYELKSFEKFRLFSFNRHPLIMVINIEDQNYMKIHGVCILCGH